VRVNRGVNRIACSPVGFGASAGLIVLIWLCYFAFPRQDVRAQATASEGRVIITLSNFKFDPKDVSLPLGGTVEWTDDTGRHMVESDDGSF